MQERKYLKNVSVKTLSWYQQSFQAFDGCSTESDYKNRIVALRDRGIKPISINTYARCINAYLKWKNAPFKLPRLKEEQKILATFSPEQVARIVHGKPVGRNQTRIHTAAITAMDTGIRINELLGLRRTDVDFDNLILKVLGKGNKHRLVPMSIELRKVLYRYLSKHNFPLVFCTQHGTQLTQRNSDRDLKLFLRKVGGLENVRCSFHTFRHTFAVNYLRKGGNLYYLQRILGHSTITTTEKYLKSLGIADLLKVHDGLSLLAR